MDTIIAFLLLTFYISLVTAIIYLAVKKTWLFMILFGVSAILAALPVGFLVEINVAGCCGGGNNGMQGIGYVVVVLVAAIGVSMIVMGRKLKKKISPK